MLATNLSRRVLTRARIRKSPARPRAGARLRFDALEDRTVPTFININGGGSSVWSIDDTSFTSNGLPAGGTSTGGATGSGASINDASIPGQGDAFDFASLVFVDNNQVNGALTQTGNTVNFAPETISGLTAQLQYYVASGSATARILLTLTNPTGAPITVTVDWVNNLGSDGGTGIQGTSSGDAAFTTADRWVVSDDGGLTSGDPAVTHALSGPGSPAVTPSAVSTTVFSAAGTEGVRATYTVTVPANSTRSLLWFHQLNTTAANGLANAAATFDTNPPAGGDLLSGLTPAQLGEVVNWSFVTPGQLHWQGDVDTNWSNAGNWLENRVPISGDTVVFDTVTAGFTSFTSNNDLAGLSLNEVRINDGSAAGDFQLTGQGVTLAGGITSGGSANSITSVQLDSITLGASQTFTTDGLSFSLGSGTTGAVNTNGFTLTIAGSAFRDLNGVISGSGGLIIEPGQDTRINAANTYDGGTLVNGNAVVQGAGTLGSTVGATTVTGALNLGNNVTSNELISLFGASAELRGRDGAVQAGNVVLNTTNSATIWHAFGNGTFTVSGSISGNAGTNGLRLLTSAVGGPGTLVLSGTNTYSGSTTIENGGTVQLLGGNALPDTSTVAIDATTLDLNGTSETIGALAGNAAAVVATGGGTLTAGGNNASTTFAGTITGTGGLTKVGTGTLTLSGANSYDGSTVVAGGTLAATNAASLGSTVGGTSVAAGATLDVRANIGAEAVSVAGAGAGGAGALVTSAGTGVVGGPVTLTGTTSAGGAGSLELAGVIGDAGAGFGVTKVGPGTLTYSGAQSNTYTGTTTVTDGTLQLNKNGGAIVAIAIPGPLIVGDGTGTDTARYGFSNQLSDTSAVTIAAGGVFDLNGRFDLIGSLAGTAPSGQVINLGSLTTGNDGTSTTYAGTITGAGGLTKVGAGTFTLSNAGSTFTGNLTVGGGAVTASAGHNDGNPTSALGNPAVARAIIVQPGAALQFAANDVLGNAAVSPVVRIVANGGTVTNTGNFFNTLGPIDLNGGTLTNVGGALPDFQAYRLTGTVTALGAAPSTISGPSGYHLNTTTTFDVADVTGDANPDLTVSAPLINQTGSQGGAAGGLTKVGPGTLALTGAAANTYTGTTTVNTGTLLLAKAAGVNAVGGDITIGDGSGSDVLRLGGDNQIPDTSVISFVSGGIGNSAKLELNGFVETVAGITSNPGQTSVIQNVEGGSPAGPAGPASPAVLTVNNAADFTFDGIIRNNASGASTLGLTKTGTGTLTLRSTFDPSATSYTGPTTVAGGTLLLDDLSNFVSPITDNAALTVHQAGQTLTLAAGVSGSGTLTKTGPGTLVLAGSNTYGGATQVNAGTLLVNGTLTASPVTVNNTGTLGGTGTVGGPVQVNAGGTLAPGAGGAGGLATGSVTFAPGSTFAIDVNPPYAVAGTDYDRLGVTGTINLGDATLTLLGGATPAPPAQVLSVLANDGADPLVGTFNGLPDGATVTVGGFTGRITYFGGDGNDIALVVDGTPPPIVGDATGEDYEVRRIANTIQILRNGVVIDARPVGSAPSYQIDAQGGTDTLFVNHGASGGMVPADVGWDGGTEIDRVTVGGYTVPRVTVTHAGLGTGAVEVGAGGPEVTFANSEPLIVAGAHADLAVNLPAGPNPDAVLADDGAVNFPADPNGPTAGRSALDGSTFEYTEFAHPTAGLTIALGAGDGLTINALDAAFNANVSVTGGAGGDTVRLAATTGSTNTYVVDGAGGADVFQVPVTPTRPVALTGGAASDTLEGPATATTYTVTGADAGDFAGPANTFAGVENLTGGVAGDTFRFTTGSLTGTIDGGGAADLLVGDNVARTYTLTGADAGTVSGILPAGFVSVENLTGGNLGDALVVQALGSLTGAFDGAAGTDSVDLSGLLAAQSLTVAALGGTDGFNVTGSPVAGGLLNINSLTATLGVDTLTGLNANTQWLINAPNGGTYRDINTTRILPFAGVENLNGGSAIDLFEFVGGSLTGTVAGNGGQDTVDGDDAGRTFALTGPGAGSVGVILPAGFTGIETLIGGSGADRLVVDPAGTLAGPFDGLAGTDTADLSALASQQITATALGAVDGFDTTGGTNVAGGLRNLNALVGSLAGTGDRLTGLNLAGTYTVSAANAGDYQDDASARTLDFANVENLTGGSAPDRLVVQAAGLLSGAFDGRAGSDTADLSATANQTPTVVATGAVDGYDLTGVTGVGGGLQNLQSIIGSAAGTADDLTGRNVAATWTVDAANAGRYVDASTRQLDFSNFENLSGGTADDRLVVQAGGSLAGSFDGGLGTDTGDFAALGSQQFVVRAVGTADGYDVTGVPTVAGDLLNVDALVGSTAGTTDRLTGLNTDSTFTVTAANGGTYRENAAARTLTFTQVENLTGGAANDLLEMKVGGSLAGSFDGTAGRDTADLSALLAVQQVTIQALGGTDGFNTTGGTTVAGGFQNVDKVVGGKAASATLGASDRLTNRDGADATFLVKAGVDASLYTDVGTGRTLVFANFEELFGGTGRDDMTVDFSAGNPLALSGITVEGRAGADSLKAVGTAARDIFSLGVKVYRVSGKVIRYTNFETIEAVGGSGNDWFYSPNVNLAPTVTLVRFFGDDGNDLASVAPTTRALLHLEGGAGTDTLKLFKGLARFLTPIPARSATSGTYFFSNRKPIEFVSFEIRDIGIAQPQP